MLSTSTAILCAEYVWLRGMAVIIVSLSKARNSVVQSDAIITAAFWRQDQSTSDYARLHLDSTPQQPFQRGVDTAPDSVRHLAHLPLMVAEAQRPPKLTSSFQSTL